MVGRGKDCEEREELANIFFFFFYLAGLAVVLLT